MRWSATTTSMCLVALLLSPSGAYAYREVFADGTLMIDEELITPENDRNTTGKPVYVHLPSLALGNGSSIGSLAVVEGDIDFDPDVDGADFLVWQRGGSPDSLSATELANWQATYGAVVPRRGNSSGISEPPMVVLGCVALFAITGSLRRS